MSQVGLSGTPIVTLFDRAIEALKRVDAESIGEVLSDCGSVGVPGSQEEFSRALTQQAIFRKLLQYTSENLRILRNEMGRARTERWRR
jgi:hypothetical protein